MGFLPPVVLSLGSIIVLLICFKASSDSPLQLSAQGCRMSYMSPSYISQRDFNVSWTPLARRYSLWLYREVGWEHELNGQPVLFIPGNAGSSRQVRSIASSSTRQFFGAPYAPVLSAPIKPADYFALEFNEDLSALHGPTLESQRKYTGAAISYILSLYPAGTSVIVMGHSMGGIIATALLPHPDIAAVITMSTPHMLPPARFDARIEDFYEHTRRALANDSTPILSLCGGATDAMIPSEGCILPRASASHGSHSPELYRRTVFASALEGAWTGVGHREMVWCHQVRWRVARAALELSAAMTLSSREAALDKWLTDGSQSPARETYPQPAELRLDEVQTEVVPSDRPLTLRNPFASKTYLLSVPSQECKFTLYMAGGSLPPVGPQHAGNLRVSVFLCSTSVHCSPLHPSAHKLIPNPVPGRVFPLPNEGTDESEGVVLFEIDRVFPVAGSHVAVKVEHAEGKGWVVGGFSDSSVWANKASTIGTLLGKITVPIDPMALSSSVHLPNLLNNALVAYRITPHHTSQPCDGTLLPPLLSHTSLHETHYYPLHTERPILLHSHASAPYLPTRTHLRGITLHVHSSGEQRCAVDRLDVSVDLGAAIGRWGARLWPALVTSAVGVASLLLFNALGVVESEGLPPSVTDSFARCVRHTLPVLLAGSLAVGLLPLPAEYALGTAGEPLFALIAPAAVALATGLVCIMWGIVSMLLLLIGRAELVVRKVLRIGSVSVHTGPRATRTAALSLVLIFALVLLLVPWQVAFLGAWAVHLHTCASARTNVWHSAKQAPGRSPTRRHEIEEANSVVLESLVTTTASPRRRWSPAPADFETASMIADSVPTPTATACAHVNEHVLLLLTWLLPLAAPVLAVWVRTLLTAGWTAPFDGDHNVLYVAPFLVLVDYASWARRPVFERHPRERISARWMLALVAVVAFIAGARYTYRIFDIASLAMTVLVACRIVPWYLQ